MPKADPSIVRRARTAKRLREKQAIEKADKRLIQSPERRAERVGVSLDWFASRMQGGKQTFLEYVRLASKEEEELRKFVDFHAQLSKIEQGQASFDEICDASGLSRTTVMARVVAESLAWGNHGAALTIAQGLPAVAEKAVEYAQTPQGDADRKMLFTATGILPTPKGTTINLQQNQFGRAPDDTSLESFDDTILEASVTHEYLPLDTGRKE